MGWVSLLEDITERFEAEFHSVQADIPADAKAVPIEKWRSIEGMHLRFQKMLSEAYAHLDLATDPNVNLAHTIKCSNDKVSELESKVKEFQKTCLVLKDTLLTREGELKKLREEVKGLRIDKNQLDKKLETAIQKNPSEIYGQFMKGANAKKK